MMDFLVSKLYVGVKKMCSKNQSMLAESFTDLMSLILVERLS